MSRPELQAPPEIVSAIAVLHLNFILTNVYFLSIMGIQKPRSILQSANRPFHPCSLPHLNLSASSTRIQQIQADMTYRALELLNIDEDEQPFLLDIGCGSGLSGEILTEEGHQWVGVDIAPSMLGEFEESISPVPF